MHNSLRLVADESELGESQRRCRKDVLLSSLAQVVFSVLLVFIFYFVLSQRANGLDTEIAAIRVSTSQEQRDVQHQMNASVASLNLQISNISATLQALNSVVVTQPMLSAALFPLVNQLAAVSQDLQDDIRKLNQSTNAQIAAINVQIAAINVQIAAITAQIATIQADVARNKSPLLLGGGYCLSSTVPEQYTCTVPNTYVTAQCTCAAGYAAQEIGYSATPSLTTKSFICVLKI